ncbi:MAG: 50S ribosomal protein L17 [Anaerolineales bacterium]|nr:50S ribosomal protein L17 [Anaerolineales bacterium]MCB9127223.1 50S ribosomal protein L17 [Ardenticatenales bacterium]MCB9171979.1 50S ribosomal protein L17 [Ardenticatenales bacterium]
MRHQVKKPHLGRDAAHRKALYRNLMTELLRHERITTTEAKAKAVRPRVEKLITKAIRMQEADRGNRAAARKEIMRHLTDKEVMFKLVDEIAPDFKERPGGYTRIVRLGTRRGDGAEMAILELVD